MKHFLDKLKKNNILTKEDILLLKKNIKEEHPHLDNSAKAHLLAKSIHKILNESLKGFTKDYKSDIKTYLIKNTFLKNKESIFQYDVLKACASSQDTSLEFIYQITKWVNKQANEEIALNVIRNIIQEIDVDAIDIEDEISLSRALAKNDENHNVNETDSQEIPDDTLTPGSNEDNPSDDEDYSDSEYPLDSNEELLHSDNNLDKDILEQKTIEPNTYKEYIIELKNKIEKIISTSITNEKTRKYILIYSLVICLLIVPIAHIIKNYMYKGREAFIEIVSSAEYNEDSLIFQRSDDEVIINKEIELITNHLPDYLKYKQINQEALRNYLTQRNSLLSNEPYFSIIIDSAKEFNINPILLFSIAGHEQSFVPKDHKFAKKIANNPYNVFQSWEKYNTDISDSSKIVSRTVINLLKDRPETEDPFKWINRKYAKDKSWWKGVKEIYYLLEEKAK